MSEEEEMTRVHLPWLRSELKRLRDEHKHFVSEMVRCEERMTRLRNLIKELEEAC